MSSHSKRLILAVLCSAITLGVTASAPIGNKVVEAQTSTGMNTNSDVSVGPFPSWANVKSYGAKGDGVTDDTAAIQRALDDLKVAGKARVLYIPAGTYKITRTLSVPGVQNLYGLSNLSVQGENPDNTTFTWGGAAGGTMIWINGISSSKFSRLTLDGQSKTSILVDQSWDGQTGFSDDFIEYSDLAFKNSKIGFRGGAFGYYAAQLSFIRNKFINISELGLVPANFNALEWWVWDSYFENCNIGIGDWSETTNGAGNFFVRNSVFKGSKFADITIGNTEFFSFRNNYSINSNRFLYTTGMSAGAPLTVQGNRIVDSIQPDPIFVANRGPLLLIDNQIRSRSGNTSSAITTQYLGDMLAIGNKFSVAKPFNIASGWRTVYVDNTVSSSTIDASAPALLSNPSKFQGPVVEVNSFTGSAIQSAIDKAVSQYQGQRPVVHLPVGTYSVTQTINIPANADVQLVGDGGDTMLVWQGASNGVNIKINGPTKATLRDMQILGGSSVVLAKGIDQPGARIFGQGLFVADNYDNIFVNRTANIDINLQDIEYPYAKGVGAKVLGPLNSNAKGRFAVFTGLSNTSRAHEFQDDVNAIIEDSWFENNSSDYQWFLKASSPSGRSAKITVNGQKIGLTGSTNSTDNPPIRIKDLPGFATFLSNSLGALGTERYALEGTNTNGTLFTLGNYIYSKYPFANTSSSGQLIGLLNRQFTPAEALPMPDNGTADNSLLRRALSQVRKERPVAQPLPSLAQGVTDLRMYRLLIRNGTSTGLRIEP